MTREEAIDKIVRLASLIGPFSPVTNALDKAVGALRAQIEREKNEPLTLDELLEMDGEPVWAEREDGYKYYSGWALVDVRWKAQNMVYMRFLRGPDEPCDLLIKYGGKIYRRKPEEKTNE